MPTDVVLEFHVARAARDRYEFDQAMFAYTGTAVLADFHAARLFAARINVTRDGINFPERAVQAGHLSAMGIIHELSHALLRRYRMQSNPTLLADALAYLAEHLGPDVLDTALHRFADAFPPTAVYQGRETLDGYLLGRTGDLSHREATLEELFMLWLSNNNPAFAPFHELFDDASLALSSAYRPLVDMLRAFLREQPVSAEFPGGATNIVDALLAPTLAAPGSLEAQLRFIVEHWGGVAGVIDQIDLYRLLSGIDVIHEEGRAFLAGAPAFQSAAEQAAFLAAAAERREPTFGGGIGDIVAADVPVVDYTYVETEPERFSLDRDWMPRCVLIAKNAFVWLDQLSKRYERQIATLGDIPDAELDALARQGITGLWLIGLWERSTASKRIKQMMGNTDAVASAYSLYDYAIAYDLGGTDALDVLRERCKQRGIRLASDMVPNHVGIDGRWVIEHPDWFVQLPFPPFPGYTFESPDLSQDDRVAIMIEDHYFDKTDAAVVFKRVDRQTGDTRFLYHGNDGTAMPWNDTAQLNYLDPQVREAVIQTILHVARQFPIIRFDAAMTLAKRHFHRLWYPEPGGGSDIASRAGYGMTRAQFDDLMPEEFWREVVDRCAVEAPDTLLLAEAFWMMESYFVRTLGMHRVYNSAFMVILRDEDNGKYRQILKNTLEFDPEILKRYVNFMNNPDERTAVDQFGKDGKYFGVAIMMVTMPGLPMFGHGQFEGFTEKYGMEYRRAYYEETPDQWLVDRHLREIAPLLHRRAIFSEAHDFLLFDACAPDGSVLEDVFAYSNRYAGQASLVLYHNRFATVRGRIHESAAYSVRSDDESRTLTHRTLAAGLGIGGDDREYVIYRDHPAGLEYIRHSQDLHNTGFAFDLGAYEYHVYLDFRTVYDHDGRYATIAGDLGGRGVPNVEAALRELFIQPLHRPLRELVNADLFQRLRAAATTVAAATEVVAAAPADNDQIDATPSTGIADGPTEVMLKPAHDEAMPADSANTVDEPSATNYAFLVEAVVRPAVDAFAAAALRYAGAETDPAPFVEATLARVLALADALDVAASADWALALAWSFTGQLGLLADEDSERGRSRYDEWLVGRVVERALRDSGLSEDAAWQQNAAVRLLSSHARVVLDAETLPELLDTLLSDLDARALLGVNRFEDVVYYRREGFDVLLDALDTSARVEVFAMHPADEIDDALALIDERVATLQAADADANYRIEQLRGALTYHEPVVAVVAVSAATAGATSVTTSPTRTSAETITEA